MEFAPVEITRHGKPVAYMVSPAMFASLDTPRESHRFASEEITSATLTVSALLDIPPAVVPTGQSLSDFLATMRDEER